jgi:hypothetical protein
MSDSVQPRWQSKSLGYKQYNTFDNGSRIIPKAF